MQPLGRSTALDSGAASRPLRPEVEDARGISCGRPERFARYGLCSIDLCRSYLARTPRGWFRIPFATPFTLGEKDSASDDDRLLIALSGSQEVWWALAEQPSEIAEMIEHNHFQPEWRSLQRMATMRLDPPPALGEAGNVINGYHRRFSRGPLNLWASDPAAGLPQELVLQWTEPQEFDEVTITFDNLADQRHENPWECGQRVLPILVRGIRACLLARRRMAHFVARTRQPPSFSPASIGGSIE